jgi:hypothetical protein
MTQNEKEEIIRRYAAGDITWSALRERGFDDYIQVLAVLGELGLRPPIAPMEGPNVETRQRGRAVIREALKARTTRASLSVSWSRTLRHF